jgi:hypothetical protein
MSDKAQKPEKRINWNITAPLIISVALALTGYFYTYQKDLYFAKRKDQLERVDRQLKELYGPLYSLSTAGTRIWTRFRQEYRSGSGFWSTNPPPTKHEAEVWRLWMKEVFMPLNLEMEALILNHSDLLVESEMPEVLLELSAHIAGYKPVLKSWDAGNYSEHLSLIDFPKGLDQYAEQNYRMLKAKQAKLLGELESR